MTINPEIYHSVEDITESYNGFLLDAYGVFWGGNAIGVLPGSAQIMESLVDQDKIVGILSNSTQLSEKEIAKLEKAGLIQGIHFHFLITSGQVAKNIFTKKQLPFPTPNLKYWLFGSVHPKFGSHHSLFEDSPYTETQNIEEADFIYPAIPNINGEDQENLEVFREALTACRQYNKPLVCANPDKFAHEGNPARLVVRQGSIAALYEALGGKVVYIGKPSANVYVEAMEKFSRYKISSPKEILMVGDNPETDIRGANFFGMPSALVTGTGIMAEIASHIGLDAAIERLEGPDLPTYLVITFGSVSSKQHH